MVIAGVLPAVVIALVSGMALWGPVVGLQHALFVLLLECALAQLLLRGLDKIPFTCSYYPGKAQIGRFWPLYLAAFSLITVLPSLVEHALLKSPSAYLIVCAALLFVVASQIWSAHRHAEELQMLRFEEEPPDTITIVNLS